MAGTGTMQRQSLQDAVIRSATVADAEAIAAIYNHYITGTVVTFEEEPILPAEMARRMDEVTSTSLPWLVAELPDKIAGYAYASKWKGRCAYRYSMEISVYLAQDRVGLGLGSRLYGELLPLLRERGVHVVIGGIALPNAASVALHEKFGMSKVAHFSEVGFKFGRWIDVGYWQRTL
jgi:phosphinothricin acetyltransferase